MESAFSTLAEPNRRAILSLLLASERSVGEIEQKLPLSQPSVSKHLRVLKEAGFVESRTAAQRRLYRLRPEPLMELDRRGDEHDPKDEQDSRGCPHVVKGK